MGAGQAPQARAAESLGATRVSPQEGRRVQEELRAMAEVALVELGLLAAILLSVWTIVGRVWG